MLETDYSTICKKLDEYFSKVIEESETVIITGHNEKKAVLLSFEEYSSLVKTVHMEANAPHFTLGGTERKEIEFCKGMEEYLKQLQEMPPEEAKKEAQRSLFASGMVDENGNLIGRFAPTKTHNKK